MLDTLHDYNAEHRPHAPTIAISPPGSPVTSGLQDAVHAAGSSRSVQGNRGDQALYGINDKRTRNFGTRCLLARRLVERGVRFVQLYPAARTTTTTGTRTATW